MKREIKRNSLAVFIILLGLFFSGCVSSHLVDSWKETERKPVAIKNVLVINVNNDGNKRRVWEDTFVKALGTKGIKAEQSYKYYPKDVPTEKDLNSILKNNFDAVMMIHKTNAELRKYRTPGMSVLTPAWGYRTPFFRSYATVYHEIYIPGRIEKEKIYELETSIYEPREDGNLIWNAVTETRNPRSTKQFSGEVSEIVMSKLLKDGLLPKRD